MVANSFRFGYVQPMKSLFFVLFFVIPLFSHSVERPVPMTYQFAIQENKSGITNDDLQILLSLLDQEFAGPINNKHVSWMKDVLWDSPYIGAGSNQIDGDFYILLMGGLVRAPYMTVGALSAVLCHELGHKLGQDPYQQFLNEGAHWSSSEGQADTFAASDCLPKLYNRLKKEAPYLLRDSDEAAAVILCRTAVNQERCRWVLTSGIDFVQSMQVYFDREIPFADPSKTAAEQPSETLLSSYPSYQCRMDIYKTKAVTPEAPRQRCWYVP